MADGGVERSFVCLCCEVGGTGAELCAEQNDPLKGKKSVVQERRDRAGEQTLSVRVVLTWRAVLGQVRDFSLLQRCGHGVGQGWGRGWAG